MWSCSTNSQSVTPRGLPVRRLHVFDQSQPEATSGGCPSISHKTAGGRIQAPSATTHHQDQPRDARRQAMEKMENKERFPRHSYGYLYGSIHGICCTWNLNVPCPIHATILSHEWDTTNPNRRAFLFLIPVPCSIAPALRSLHRTPSNDPIAICPCASSTGAFPSLTTSRVSIPASRAGSSSRTTSEKKQTSRGSTCSKAAIAL